MKKYNRPEIVTLALETVDVIETSGGDLGKKALNTMYTGAQAYNVYAVKDDIDNMTGQWQW